MDIRNRITPENILELKENEIFVFGSNRRNLHGAGAAKLALIKWLVRVICIIAFIGACLILLGF